MRRLRISRVLNPDFSLAFTESLPWRCGRSVAVKISTLCPCCPRLTDTLSIGFRRVKVANLGAIHTAGILNPVSFDITPICQFHWSAWRPLFLFGITQRSRRRFPVIASGPVWASCWILVWVFYQTALQLRSKLSTMGWIGTDLSSSNHLTRFTMVSLYQISLSPDPLLRNSFWNSLFYKLLHKASRFTQGILSSKLIKTYPFSIDPFR